MNLHCLSSQDTDSANDAISANSISASTEDQRNVVREDITDMSICTHEPNPTSVNQSTNNSVLTNDYSGSIEMGSLLRKRKLEQQEAAETIARIEAEEEKRNMEFETRILELERRRLQREKSLVVNSLGLDSSTTNVQQNLKSPSIPSHSVQFPVSREVQSNSKAHSSLNNNNNNNIITNEMSNETVFQQFAIALTQAIQKSTSTSNEQVGKFIARQAHPRELTSFYGDPDDWPTFITEFEGSSTECQFTNVENMARLRKCLRGKAKEAVKSMLILPENVDLVIRTLQMNFGRPELIISTLINKINKIPKVADGKPDAILQLSNSVMNLVSTMKILNETGHMTNPQLLCDLEDKLPTYTKIQWAQVKMQVDEPVTLFHLAEWLQEFSSGLSRVGSIKIHHEKDEPSPKRRKDENDDRKSRNKETVLSITDTTTTSNPKPNKCIFLQFRETQSWSMPKV